MGFWGRIGRIFRGPAVRRVEPAKPHRPPNLQESLRNLNCPREILEAHYRDAAGRFQYNDMASIGDHPTIREAINQGRESTNAADLSDLANSPVPAIREAVAANQNTPPGILSRLVTTKASSADNARYSFTAARNPKTPTKGVTDFIIYKLNPESMRNIIGSFFDSHDNFLLNPLIADSLVKDYPDLEETAGVSPTQEHYLRELMDAADILRNRPDRTSIENGLGGNDRAVLLSMIEVLNSRDTYGSNKP